METTERMVVAVIVGEAEDFNEGEHTFFFFDATEKDAQLVREACTSYTKRHDNETATLSTARELLNDYGEDSEMSLRESMVESHVEQTDLRGVLKGLL